MGIVSKVRKVLATRKIFRNWAALAAGYAANRGLRARCVDGGVIEISREIYRALARAADAGVINSLGCGSKELYVCGLGISLEDLEEYGWVIDSKKICNTVEEAVGRGVVMRRGAWLVNGVYFKELRQCVVEVFLMNHWPLDDIDLRDREVLDIGAYVGDTPLYFVKHGARRVIAVEPHPLAYREMVENIELNNMWGRIVPLNIAIGPPDGYVEIPIDLSMHIAAGTWFIPMVRSGGPSTRVRTAGLDQLAPVVRDRYMVKIDCEGCEYEILGRGWDALKQFENVLIEYHWNRGFVESRLSKIYRCEDHRWLDDQGVGVLICRRA